jgi:3-oxoacyl-[acyl-carrier-protein] synthase-1
VSPLVLTSFTAVNALGRGRDAIFRALHERRSGLARCTFENAKLDTWCGMVEGMERPITGDLALYDCRNNRLSRSRRTISYHR